MCSADVGLPGRLLLKNAELQGDNLVPTRSFSRYSLILCQIPFRFNVQRCCSVDVMFGMHKPVASGNEMHQLPRLAILCVHVYVCLCCVYLPDEKLQLYQRDRPVGCREETRARG